MQWESSSNLGTAIRKNKNGFIVLTGKLFLRVADLKIKWEILTPSLKVLHLLYTQPLSACSCALLPSCLPGLPQGGAILCRGSLAPEGWLWQRPQACLFSVLVCLENMFVCWLQDLPGSSPAESRGPVAGAVSGCTVGALAQGAPPCCHIK